MKNVALLRANPKDTAYIKVLTSLIKVYHIDCYMWDRLGDFSPVIENKNIEYKKCGISGGFYRTSTILKLFLFEAWLFFKLLFVKVDCIHAIDLDTGLIGLFIAKLRGKKFVYQCLDPYYAVVPDRWPEFLVRFVKRLENMVISNAAIFIITDLLRMPQHEGSKPKHLLEIANVPYLDIHEISETKKKDFVTGYIGALFEGRNLITIIEVAGELEDEGVNLIIGGFGPLEGKVKELAGKYKNVRYISWIPYSELLNIESSFDVFMHITDTKNEGQKWTSPNKLFESMVFGKPIIVGEGTLAGQRVASIGNGVVVPYGSKEELKKAILRFKNNPNFIKEMGEKGKSEFEKNWRPEIMEKRLSEAYRKVIG